MFCLKYLVVYLQRTLLAQPYGTKYIRHIKKIIYLIFLFLIFHVKISLDTDNDRDSRPY